MSRLKMRFTLLVTMTLLLVGVSRVSAGGSSPNVAVYTSTGQPNGAFITTFAPDGTSKGKIAIADAFRASISPSLQWYTTSTTQGQATLQVMPVTNFTVGAPINVKLEPGFDVTGATFNWDSAYLLYVLTKLGDPQYIIGIFELQTGKQVEYSVAYSQTVPNAKTGFSGAGSPIFLDAQTGQLIMNTFIPYAGGSSHGLYVVNIGNFAALQAGRYPLPPVTQIATADQYSAYAGPQFLSSAPGGSKYLAYFSKNSDNVPANYQEAPFSQQYNMLNILDLTTGQSIVAAQAGKGQGLEKLAWSPFNPVAKPSGDKVYFTGGNYQNTAFISQPRLYTLQVNTNTVTEGPVLTTDPNEDIQTLMVCTDTVQDTLYFVGGNPNNGTATLYSAPINDMSQKKTLVSGSFIGLLGCVPPA